MESLFTLIGLKWAGYFLSFCTYNTQQALPPDLPLACVQERLARWYRDISAIAGMIIVNVSSSFTSFDLMPSFYRYGYGFLFFNSERNTSYPWALLKASWGAQAARKSLDWLTSLIQIQGARTIIFGTKNHLGRNSGVLLAWVVVGLAGMLLLTAWTLNENRKKAHNLR